MTSFSWPDATATVHNIGAHRYVKAQGDGAGLLVLGARRGGHRGVEAVDAGLLLGGAGLGAAADPVELAAHERGAVVLPAGLLYLWPLFIVVKRWPIRMESGRSES